MQSVPEGFRRNAQHQASGLAGHDGVHSLVLRRRDELDQAVEVFIRMQRNVGNADAADVVCHAHRTHRVELGLYRGVSGRNQNREFLAPA
ncbi:hypothetical protein D9M69_683020 [compost metagenome]